MWRNPFISAQCFSAHCGTASRIVAAICGGYALAALTSLAALLLPIDRVQAVLTGMMAGLLVFACAVICVFAARSAWRAWCGILLSALPLALAAWLAHSQGAVA